MDPVYMPGYNTNVQKQVFFRLKHYDDNMPVILLHENTHNSPIMNLVCTASNADVRYNKLPCHKFCWSLSSSTSYSQYLGLTYPLYLKILRAPEYALKSLSSKVEEHLW